MTCVCGSAAEVLYDRRDLAKHIVDKHGTNAPRALMLAQKLIDRVDLTPDEWAIFGVEPQRRGATSSERRASLATVPGLPSDADLDRAAARAKEEQAKTQAAPATTSTVTVVTELLCTACKQRPRSTGKAWCEECRETARQRASGRRGPRTTSLRAVQENVAPDATESYTPAPGEWGNGPRDRRPEPVPIIPVDCPEPECGQTLPRRMDRPSPEDRARLQHDGRHARRPEKAERDERRARPTPTPATPAISPAPEETTMPKKADPDACKLCARLTRKAGEPTKCKWHGGAGHSTSNRGRGAKKTTRKTPKRTTSAAAAATPRNGFVGSVAAHIRGLVQAVANGKRAEAELAAARAELQA